jgi:hypothetical protein
MRRRIGFSAQWRGRTASRGPSSFGRNCAAPSSSTGRTRNLDRRASCGGSASVATSASSSGRSSGDGRGRHFLYAPPSEAQLSRALDIDAAYPALGLGLVDASIVALAEELGVTRLLTRDVRDFSAVRLGDGCGFDLVVSPVRPEPAKRRRRRVS